jgi:hypothetical protein
MNSIFSNPAAFSPFFDERVRVEAIRPEGKVSGSFLASVMPIEDDEVIDPSKADTERKRFTVLIPVKGEGAWNLAALGTAPQMGDKVTLCCALKTAVTKVELMSDYYSLETREI